MISSFVLKTAVLNLTLQIVFIAVGFIVALYSYGIYNLRLLSYRSSNGSGNNEEDDRVAGRNPNQNFDSVVPSE
jgi:hypothetical protein